MLIAAAPVPADSVLVTLRAGAPAGALGRDATRLWPGSRTYAVPVRRGSVALAVDRFARNPGVAAVEPNRRRTPTARPNETPNDPLFAQQSYLAEIDWSPPEEPLRRPIVAVLDTGVAPVAELVGRIDIPGAQSFVPGRLPLNDPEGHGTHVAGIIASATDNGVGIAGIAYATILPVTVGAASGDQTGATTASLVQGIRYAISKRARIINISFAGDGYSAIEQAAIDDAARVGILVVAASGNSGSRPRRQYPGAYRHVLAVAATGPGGLAHPLSTPGPQVAIAAPGTDIISTATTLDVPGAYVARTGTSVATPMVSGAAARLLARDPTLKASQLREMLVGTARDLPPAGIDESTGHGMLDLAAALSVPRARPDSAEPDETPAHAEALAPLISWSAQTREIRGTLAAWSDPRDCRVAEMREGDRLDVWLDGEGSSDLDLVIWRPGTPATALAGRRPRPWTVAASLGPRAGERVRFTAKATGRYLVEARLSDGSGGRYRLRALRLPRL